MFVFSSVGPCVKFPCPSRRSISWRKSWTSRFNYGYTPLPKYIFLRGHVSNRVVGGCSEKPAGVPEGPTVEAEIGDDGYSCDAAVVVVVQIQISLGRRVLDGWMYE